VKHANANNVPLILKNMWEKKLIVESRH